MPFIVLNIAVNVHGLKNKFTIVSHKVHFHLGPLNLNTFQEPGTKKHPKSQNGPIQWIGYGGVFFASLLVHPLTVNSSVAKLRVIPG